MNLKKSKIKTFFKGMVLVVAFAICMTFVPLCDIAEAAANLVNREGYYSFIALKGASTTVVKGQDYSIKTAYLVDEKNSKEVPIGLEDYSSYNQFTKIESSVVVKYYDGSEVTVDSSSVEGIYGTFNAKDTGEYTISYSVTFETAKQESTTYTYDLTVVSTLSSAHFTFPTNSANMIPEVYDTSIAGVREVKLPLPKVFGEDSKEVEGFEIVTDYNSIEVGSNKDQVLIEIKGGISGVALAYGEGKFFSRELADGSKEYYIDSSVFSNELYGNGNYYITYKYYHNGIYIVSDTKEMNVTSSYYDKYELDYEISSSWSSSSAVTGVEQELKSVVGLNKESKDEVASYYTVSVLYKENSTDNVNSYKEITDAQGTLRLEDGVYYFTPLVDGYYTVIYTVYDFYGNSISSDRAQYEFTDVKDTQDPTIIIYDASEKDAEGVLTYADASSKIKSKSGRNDIVVYAISGEDNATKTEELNLYREIRTSSSTLLTIRDYDDSNLVFNYGGYGSFLANNYLVRNVAGNIESNEEMLAWFNENGYRIVVNNTNYTSVAEKFTQLLADNNIVKGEEETDTDYNKRVLDFFKGEAAKDAGFAYLDTSYNFGSSTGTFYVYYVAIDKNNNDTETSRSILISSAYGDIEMPVVTFPTTLKDAYTLNEKVTFDKPSVSDDNDGRLDVVTMYRYITSTGAVVTEILDEEENNVATNSFSDSVFDTNYTEQANVVKALNAGKYLGNGYIKLDTDESSYTIDLSEAKDKDAVKVQILVYAFDDSGNCGVYYQTLDIADEGDVAPLRFDGIDGEIEDSYLQGSEIKIPTIGVKDDNVSYITSNVKVFYTTDDEKVDVTAYDVNATKSPLKGTYVLDGGYFIATYAGSYQVQVEIVDAGDNRIVVFFDYNVKGIDTVQDPTISTTLTSQTVELDKVQSEPISIPTPSVNYNIANSAVYTEDMYDNQGNLTEDYKDIDYVVLGVDENGKALDWSTNYGTNANFAPDKVGTYKLKYTVNISTYDAKLLRWVPFDRVNYTGGYVAYISDEGSEFIVDRVIENEGTDDETSYITFTEVKSKQVFKYDEISSFDAFISMTEEEFNNIYREYTFESETYTIVCQDKTGPVIYGYDYEKVIAWEDCPGYGEDGVDPSYELTIKPINATDASGIDLSRSRALLTWTLSNGESGSRTYTGSTMNSWSKYTITADGTYSITYTVYDNNGNYTTSEAYTIKVGDVTPPVLTVADDLVKEKYNLGDTLVLDTAKIEYSDEKSEMDSEKPIVITLTNTTTNETIKNTASEGYYSYKLDTAGTYELEIEVKDAVGNTTSKTLKFSVETEASNSVEVYKVVGIVLIVVSCLILVGVIAYFVISKIKLDRELKK